MRYLLVILLTFIAVPVSAETVLFKDNLAKVEIPPGYSYRFEDRRGTLVLVPPNQPNVEVRFTFNSLKEYVKQRPSIGKDFVQDAGRKKGKELFAVPGNDGVAFVDVSESGVAAGERIRSIHGIMGVNSGYVTFTVTTTEALADSEFVKQLLIVGIRDLLGRVKAREV